MSYIGQLQYRINLGNDNYITTEGLKLYNVSEDTKEVSSVDLLNDMKAVAGASGEDVYIAKLGIQAPPGSEWTFVEEASTNKKSIYIGTTGIYELDNVKLLGLEYKAQFAINSDTTAQYIEYDNAIEGFEKGEDERVAFSNITDDTVEAYIKTQREFYSKFITAVEHYDNAFKGLYWNAGIIDPKNIIIDFILEKKEAQECL